MYLENIHYKVCLALRYWFKHRNLLSGSCWNASNQRGEESTFEIHTPSIWALSK